MDTLSDVLRVVRLTGAVFFTVDASAPWIAESPAGSAVGPHIMPGTEHVIHYHLIKSGSCWGGLLDEPALRLEAGDFIIFPQGDPHVVSSAPGMRNPPDVQLYRQASCSPVPIAMSLRGGGAPAQLICGFLGCDARPFNPLLATLPRVIHLRGNAGADTGLRSLVELALAESSERKPGSDGVLARLSELLFVEVVRRHLVALPPDTVGWFAGLRDEAVGRALRELHARPAHTWTLDELAKEVGISRSTLAERFTHFVGVPPIQYLAKWRIQLAASLLRSGSQSLAEIAEQIGYGSEAALSRAFKRLVGVAPATYRRHDGLETAQG